MSKLDIILGITAAISLVVTFKVYAENQKMRKEGKKHKCAVGTTFCNDDPLTCGCAREG